MAVSKYIEEEVLLAFDFANQDELTLLGETLSSIVSIVFTPTDAKLVLNSKGAAAIVGSQVRVWVKGGSSGQSYTGLCLALTSAGKSIASRMPLVMLD